MKSNDILLILGILSILIILSFVQNSTAKPHNDEDEDSGWWDARDYYNRLDRSTDSFLITISIIFVVLILGVIIIRTITHRTKERRYFSSELKRQVLKNQNYKCAICKRSTGVWDYDHKNGDRSNNKLSNCQALCPNCHAKKTRGLLKTTEKSKPRLLKIFVIIIIFIIFLIFFPYLLNLLKG